MSLPSYSTDPNANTTINSTFIGEGCPPGNVNDAIRNLMSDIASFFSVSSGSGIGISAGGTGATTAAAALTSLGAAASGANADITSLTGLTTPLAPAEGGTGMAGVASALSANANGYVKLYNGLIIQWGTATIGNGGNLFEIDIAFPATFPNAVWIVTGSPDGGANSGYAPLFISYPLLSVSSFRIHADSGAGPQGITAGRKVRWIAIGN